MSRNCCYKNAGAKTSRVLRFLMFCSILDAIYKLVQAVDGQAQAFIHTEQELRYLVDDIAIQAFPPPENPAVSFSELDEESHLGNFESPIIFEPPTLNFGIHPMGMPRLERVVVQNPSQETSVHLLSISGSTLHFHCSFFQEKVIPPGGNTSFDVVFLARQEGPVENTLYIHTSLGSFKYQVMALGVANPFRLQPFLGVRMPLNSSFAPLIHMHNPHSSTIQVTEMFTSGGDLHLELPSGESELSRQLWELNPFETKVVMRANFVARVERNHTAYIRIKTNSTRGEYLVVPLEVEVSSVAGIYSPTSVLDFGVVRSQDEPRTLPILLLNSGPKHVQIVNVIVAPVNEILEVKFNPVKIPPDTLHPTLIANLTIFPWRVMHARKQSSGKIVVKAKNNQFKLIIPYQITLLQGSLGFNINSTRFYVGGHSTYNSVEEGTSTFTQRSFNVTNNFNVTVVVFNASLPLEARSHFMLNLNLPVHLPPGTSATLGSLLFLQHTQQQQQHSSSDKGDPLESDRGLETELTLHTNISVFTVPLVAFTGRLQIFLPQTRGSMNKGLNSSRQQSESPHLDFGTLALEEKRTLMFAAINENPVDVDLKHWGSNVSRSYVELVGVDKGNTSTLAATRAFWHAQLLAKSLRLKPHHYALLRVCITAPSEEGLYYGEAFLETQYEMIKVPFTFRASQGNLVADDLYFDNAFPGKISSQPLYIRSTFSHPMKVTSLSPIPDDVRFLFEPSKGASLLQPETKNLVGKVFFDPRRECKTKCYSGLPTTTTMGFQWLQGVGLPSDVGESDAIIYKSLRDRWQGLLDAGERDMNVTFQLDTSEVRGFFLRAHATLQWPRLSAKCHLRFPITQVGNTTVKEFALENPSSLPVLAQVVWLGDYPDPQRALSMLSHRLGAMDSLRSNPELRGRKVAGKGTDVFTLQDLEQYNTQPDNLIPAYRQSLEEYYSIETHRRSIALLLTPGMRVRVRVGFTPLDEISRTSLLLIRNNLTVLDALVLQGQGGRGQIRFGNKDPGTDAVLMFELTEKHLKDCEATSSNGYFSHSNNNNNHHQQQQQQQTGSGSSRFLLQPNLTVRRAFLARNTGELPVYIRGFDVSGLPCQGYGFRVLDCQGFELKPNASRKIDIAYTPDFTLSRVERTLHLHTSSGHLLPYTLVATLPRSLLLPCSQSLPRPQWESVLFYAVTFLVLLLLLGVLTAAYFEGDRILRTGFYPMTTMSLSANLINSSTSGNANNPDLEGFAPDLDKVFDLKAIGRDTRRSYDRRHDVPKGRTREPPTTLPTTLSSVSVPSGRRRKSRQRSVLKEDIALLSASVSMVSSASSRSQLSEIHPSVSRMESEPPPEPYSGLSLNLSSHHWLSQLARRMVLGLFTWFLSSLSSPHKDNSADNSLTSPHRSTSAPDINLDEDHHFQAIDKRAYYENSVNPSFNHHHNHSESKGRHRRHNQQPRATTADIGKETCHHIHHHHHHHHTNDIKVSDNNNIRPVMGEEMETSSTTTESSNAESDLSEKDLNSCSVSTNSDFSGFAQTHHDVVSRHLTSTLRVKQSRSSSATSSEENHPLNNNLNQNNNNISNHKEREGSGRPSCPEGDFELSSKSRGHKKIKVDPSKVYGGDILKPSTLELPYKPKPVTLSGVSCGPRSVQQHHQQRLCPTSSVTSKIVKRTNTKLKGPHQVNQHTLPQQQQQQHSLLHEFEHQGNIYQSLWDPPSALKNHDDSLSEIAQQTENFALRLSGKASASQTFNNNVSAGPQNRPPPPPPPPTNRKASLDAGNAVTYSSVVSGESNIAISGTNTNVTNPNSFGGKKIKPPGGERSNSARSTTTTTTATPTENFSTLSHDNSDVPVRPQSLPLDMSLFWSPVDPVLANPTIKNNTEDSLYVALEGETTEGDSIGRAILGGQSFTSFQPPLSAPPISSKVLSPDVEDEEGFYPALSHSSPPSQHQQLQGSRSGNFWGPVGGPPFSTRGQDAEFHAKTLGDWNNFELGSAGTVGSGFLGNASNTTFWDPGYLREPSQWGHSTATTNKQDGSMWNRSLWSDTTSGQGMSGLLWSTPFLDELPSPDPLDLIQATLTQQPLSPQDPLDLIQATLQQQQQCFNTTEQEDREQDGNLETEDSIPAVAMAAQLGYDPFRTLSSIWSPKAPTNKTTPMINNNINKPQVVGGSSEEPSSPWSFLLFANNATADNSNADATDTINNA